MADDKITELTEKVDSIGRSIQSASTDLTDHFEDHRKLTLNSFKSFSLLFEMVHSLNQEVKSLREAMEAKTDGILHDVSLTKESIETKIIEKREKRKRKREVFDLTDESANGLPERKPAYVQSVPPE
jgi:chromosome segregation ATPase